MNKNMHAAHINAQPVYGTPKVLGLKLLETEATEYVELTLMEEGNVPAHSLEIPVTFYVAEGAGTLSVDGKEFKVGKGDMVMSKAGSVRELTNTGKGDLRVLVMKHAV